MYVLLQAQYVSAQSRSASISGRRFCFAWRLSTRFALSAINWSLAASSAEQPANARDEGVPRAEFVVNVGGDLYVTNSRMCA